MIRKVLVLINSFGGLVTLKCDQIVGFGETEDDDFTIELSNGNSVDVPICDWNCDELYQLFADIDPEYIKILDNAIKASTELNLGTKDADNPPGAGGVIVDAAVAATLGGTIPLEQQMTAAELEAFRKGTPGTAKKIKRSTPI